MNSSSSKKDSGGLGTGGGGVGFIMSADNGLCDRDILGGGGKLNGSSFGGSAGTAVEDDAAIIGIKLLFGCGRMDELDLVVERGMVAFDGGVLLRDEERRSKSADNVGGILGTIDTGASDEGRVAASLGTGGGVDCITGASNKDVRSSVIFDVEPFGNCSRAKRGGGANGAGSFVGSGVASIIFDNALSWSSSILSLALGTISDRNSKSSGERASEFLELEPADLAREKRLRKRETAVGSR